MIIPFLASNTTRRYFIIYPVLVYTCIIWQLKTLYVALSRIISNKIIHFLQPAGRGQQYELMVSFIVLLWAIVDYTEFQHDVYGQHHGI